jgi:hypothetical protein
VVVWRRRVNRSSGFGEGLAGVELEVVPSHTEKTDGRRAKDFPACT